MTRALIVALAAGASLVVAGSSSAQAQSYVRSRAVPQGGSASDPNLHCLWWPQGSLQFVQSASGDPAAPNALAAISRAIASWKAVFDQCGNLTYSEGTPVDARTIGYDSTAGATNTNLILFRTRNCSDSQVVPRSDPCLTTATCANQYDCWSNGYASGTLALTTTTYDVATGTLYDSDTEIDAADYFYTTVDSPRCPSGAPSSSCVAYDVQNTMTHELGHAIGLGHSPDLSSTMNAQASMGDLNKRIIDPGSQQFVCDVYPKGAASRDCLVAVATNQVGPQVGCNSAGGLSSAIALLGMALGFARALVLRRRRS